MSVSRVISRDGTAIAFECFGQGPALILVVGAFNDRSTGAPLATFLAPHFSVFTYDRRGRGDSGDTAPYAVQREIDDLAALIAEAGDSAAVFGYSSGAILALQAAGQGLPVSKLALYDAPYIVDAKRSRAEPDHTRRLTELLAQGRRGEAVEYFQSHVVGIPEDVVVQLRHAPFRPALEEMAHTLAYETAILGDGRLPTGLAATTTMPTLVVAGGTSPFMCAAAQALGRALPDGRVRILDGQGHDMDSSVLGPVLRAFLTQ
ncbi:MAG TPA: alpha/beta hydrolase [Chloroflexota bacterium]|nr:alpha/beta hydrolase [Chloroflexota bacterium]